MRRGLHAREAAGYARYVAEQIIEGHGSTFTSLASGWRDLPEEARRRYADGCDADAAAAAVTRFRSMRRNRIS